METKNEELRKLLSESLTELIIRIGLAALLIVLCVRIFAPFLHLMLWAIVLAIALFPLHQALAKRMGNRSGGAATIIVLVGLLLVGVPTFMLGGDFADQVHGYYTKFENDELTVPEPSPKVAEWPVVGKSVYETWKAVADDLPAYVEENKDKLQDIAKRTLSAAASTVASVLGFLGSLIIAGILMAYAQPGAAVTGRIMVRLAGETDGPRLQRLSTATVRSVAVGVIGVAFIQALLLGVGFVIAGVPGSGIWAVLVMLLGIAQLPALIVSLPVIIYIWAGGDGSNVFNVVMTVYLFLAGLADNVLKPLLLGRGVDTPMPVVLIGALGGMVTAGLVGLFIGAVILAVGYEIMMAWVNTSDRAVAKEGDSEPVTG